MVEINAGWYARKVKAQVKALKVADDMYSFPNEERVHLLRMVRDELLGIAGKLAKDIATYDLDEREREKQEGQR